MSTNSTRQDLEDLVADWRRERPDVDMAALAIVFPLRRALQSAEEHRSAILSRYGLTPASLDLLVALRRVGPPYASKPSGLARHLVLTAGGVSQRLERLQDAGLVTREISAEDRREVIVTLTKKGIDLLDRFIPEYMAHELKLLCQLSTNERATLSRLLLKLDDSVRNCADDQPVAQPRSGRHTR
jgi:DNA-binding MarR family transcriptional regulator